MTTERTSDLRPKALEPADQEHPLPTLSDLMPRRSDDLIERARAAIHARLGTGTTSLDEVARALGVSARTLQRRLHEQSQTVSRLLDECRRERVMELLASGTPTKVIALDTGFGDVPALYRAFRRWTGTTPRRYAPQTIIPPAFTSKTA